MADVSGIINAIEAAIYTNGAELITGDILQAVLETMVNGLNTLKEDALVSGTNIKTVDGNSVLGSGDLSLSDVKYTAQTLTDAQKAQARANIGAMQNYVDAGTQDLYVRVNTINAPFAISVKYSKGGSDKFFNTVVNYDISGDAFYILEVHGLSGYVGYYLGEDENSTTWLHIFNSAGEGTVSFALLPMTTQALPTWTNTTPTDYSDDSAVTPFIIGAGSSDVFWVTYGTTTYADIVAAYTAGKIPVCLYDDNLYVLSRIDSYYAYFGGLNQNILYYLRVSSASVYSKSLLTAEITSNKVSTISGYETDTTKYPNTKAMADYAEKKWTEQTIEVTDEATDKITFTADPNATELEFDIIIAYNQTTANYLFCCPDSALHGVNQDAFARPQITANVVYFKMTARCIKLGASFMSQGVSGTGSVLADIIGSTSQLWQCPSGRTYTQNFASITFGFSGGNKYLGIGSKITIRYR